MRLHIHMRAHVSFENVGKSWGNLKLFVVSSETINIEIPVIPIIMSNVFMFTVEAMVSI